MSAQTPMPGLVLASDYNARMPLWTAGGNVWGPGQAPQGLAPELVDALLAWQSHFDEHFRIDRWPHWDSKEAAVWYERQASDLHERLQRALPGRVVTLDLWPVHDVAQPSG